MNNILSKNTNLRRIDNFIYTHISLLYYSFIFSYISSHIINDKFNNKSEQNKFIMETSILIFCLCKMEIDRLL